MLRQGVQGISDLITLPGLINLDFADVRTIMSDAGHALLGIGMGTGDKRALDAAEQADLLAAAGDRRSRAPRSILLSITGGRDLSLWEVNEAAQAVQEAAHPDANIIFGAMVDEKLARTRCGSRSWPPATARTRAARGRERSRGRWASPRGEPRVSRAAAVRAGATRAASTSTCPSSSRALTS